MRSDYVCRANRIFYRTCGMAFLRFQPGPQGQGKAALYGGRGVGSYDGHAFSALRS